MEIEVLCIGHAAWDLSLPVRAYPPENSKVEIEEIHECGGGPAANAACLLGRWGAKTAFAGWVGDDHYGRRIHQEFEESGVDVSFLEMRAGCSTPFSVIIVSGDGGSRTIINRKSPGHESRLNWPPGGPAPAVLLFDGHEPAASLQALALFPGALSILDAGSWREGTARLAGEVDYLVASERFAAQAWLGGRTSRQPGEGTWQPGEGTGPAALRRFLGSDAPPRWDEAARAECAQSLRARYQTEVVVTFGEEGLVAAGEGGLCRMPAFPADVADTTGAGDVFHGAFAWAILKNLPFEQVLRLSSMAASLSVRKRGGRSSIPKLSEVEEALCHAE